MKKTKKYLCFLLIIVLALSFSSCSLNQTTIEYKTFSDHSALYRYKGYSTTLTYTVPDTYENKPLTELMAFSIANADYLEEVNIGVNVNTIDKWTFTNCQSLKAINVDENNEHFKSVDGVLYNKDMTVILAYPNAKAPLVTDEDNKVIGGGEFVCPDTLKEIGENAFYLCGNLYSITFNDGLEKINDKAFIKCTNLNSISIPDTVTEIGVDAFSYCNALTTLEIPSSVQKIGDYAFFTSSSSIEKIFIHNDSEDDIEFGTDWQPNKKNSVREKVPFEFVGK